MVGEGDKRGGGTGRGGNRRGPKREVEERAVCVWEGGGQRVVVRGKL